MFRRVYQHGKLDQSKKMWITHVEVPTNLLCHLPHGKRERNKLWRKLLHQAHVAPEVDAPKKKARISTSTPPYHADFKEFFEQPLKDAGYPGLNRICRFAGLEQNQILPTLSKKTCRTCLITEKCMQNSQYKFEHCTATKEEADTITAKLKHFKDDPLGCKGEKEMVTVEN